ncbi:hypothetical protein Lser_V15G46301 [Lactuca serriola]
MDPNPEIEKYARAKIEEQHPDLPLHLSLLKPDGGCINPHCYMKIFEEEGKAQKLTEAFASGETLVRKLHRIRNKELVKFIDKDFNGIKDIHVISKATIGVVADAESNLLNHSFLDMVGTAGEVKHAEELILDNILKSYSSICYPVILMPPGICWDKINIPLHKVCRVLGTYGSNLLRIEVETKTWIKIEQGPSPGVWEWERVVNVFGPKENVNKAKSVIQSVISDQPGELSATEALNEFLKQFKEPSCSELIDTIDEESNKKSKKQKVGEHKWGQTFLRVKKSDGEGSKETEGKSEFKVPTWSQTFGHVASSSPGGSKQTKQGNEYDNDDEYSGEVEKEKLQAEEGGSGSGSSSTEKEKKKIDKGKQHMKSEDE